MRCARVTFLSSRTNTMLSIPLLVLMARFRPETIRSWRGLDS
jgi:hypothetical protein